MRNPLTIHRRQFLGGAAALGVSALAVPAWQRPALKSSTARASS
jgi:TAT (twin-arginine translocation) pathway signal sequence